MVGIKIHLPFPATFLGEITVNKTSFFFRRTPQNRGMKEQVIAAKKTKGKWGVNPRKGI